MFFFVCFNFGLSCNSALCSVAVTPILGVKGEGCTNPKRLVWPGQKAKRAQKWGAVCQPYCLTLRRGCL